jgi:hypothetical protein
MNKALITAGAVLLALVLVARKPREATGAEATDMESIKDALKVVRAVYGLEIARNVERIYRLETNHFKSGGFKATNAPGMRATKETFPFGWAKRTMTPEQVGPLWEAKDNIEGVTSKWVVFKEFQDAAVYLAEFLKAYENNAGRWNSTDPAKQASYRAALAQINTPLVG